MKTKIFLFFSDYMKIVNALCIKQKKMTLTFHFSHITDTTQFFSYKYFWNFQSQWLEKEYQLLIVQKKKYIFGFCIM